jgi:hypothetical protein
MAKNIVAAVQQLSAVGGARICKVRGGLSVIALGLNNVVKNAGRWLREPET